ncbi:MAG: TRL-like family protein [Rikenellaceae bacterium]
MKKSFLVLASMAFVAAVVTSCASVKTPLGGAFYMNVKDGLAVTSNTGSSKVGTATAKGYVGLYAAGDASIEAAAKNGGITTIHHVDYHSTSLLGIINTYTTVVYGK